jgi:integrase
VVEALEPIWKKKTETATRVRQRIEAVLDWAAVRGYRSGDNPARWRGHLDKLLPKPTRLKKVTHRAALPYAEMSAFMQELRATAGQSALALELQVLTATRPGEVVGAGWSEFDLKAGVWTIPGERMKAGRPHRIPLSPAALAVLAKLPQLEEFTFPGRTSGRSMTTAAPMKTLKALRPGLTAHGFRSSFRDWAADTTAYPREVAEEALAHTLKDRTEAAYRRSDLFEKRTRLMADWAAHCANGANPTVASIGDARRKKKVAAK